MKYFAIIIIFFITACNGAPLIAPATLQTTWVDSATHSDTIITNVNNEYPVIYYAAKSWQSSADTTLTHGYKFIAIRFGDSVLVKPLNDPSTNYDGPFFLKANNDNTILKAQNFLDTGSVNYLRNFIPLQ